MKRSIKILLVAFIIILMAVIPTIFFAENTKSNQVGIDKIPSSKEIKKLVISQFGKEKTVTNRSAIEKFIKLIDSNSCKKPIASRDDIDGTVYVVKIIPAASPNNTILVVPYGNTFNYLVTRNHKKLVNKWYELDGNLSDVATSLYCEG